MELTNEEEELLKLFRSLKQNDRLAVIAVVRDWSQETGIYDPLSPTGRSPVIPRSRPS